MRTDLDIIKEVISGIDNLALKEGDVCLLHGKSNSKVGRVLAQSAPATFSGEMGPLVELWQLDAPEVRELWRRLDERGIAVGRHAGHCVRSA